MSLEEQIRTDLASAEAIVADLESKPGNGLSYQIVLAQMKRRTDDLRSQLDAALSRTLELSFFDTHRPESTAISSDILSALLGRIQTSLTYATWAHHAGPGVQGKPPASIERDARTEVVATPAGSFGLVLRKTDNALSDAFDDSTADVLSLLGAAQLGRFDDAAEQTVMRLGREAIRRLELLFKRLADEGIDTSVSLSTPAESRTAFVTHTAAEALSKWLGDAVPTVEQFDILVTLRRADSLSGGFKVESQATGEMYEGGCDPDVVAGRTLDASYVATLQRTTQTAAHTKRKTERYRLLALVGDVKADGGPATEP